MGSHESAEERTPDVTEIEMGIVMAESPEQRLIESPEQFIEVLRDAIEDAEHEVNECWSVLSFDWETMPAIGRLEARNIVRDSLYALTTRLRARLKGHDLKQLAAPVKTQRDLAALVGRQTLPPAKIEMLIADINRWLNTEPGPDATEVQQALILLVRTRNLFEAPVVSEQKDEVTRVDDQTVIPPERATASEANVIDEHLQHSPKCAVWPNDGRAHARGTMMARACTCGLDARFTARAVRESPAATASEAVPALTMSSAAEMLWIVLANVSGGDWTKQTPEWQEAAARWRDNYFEAVRQAPAQADLPTSTSGQWTIQRHRYTCDVVDSVGIVATGLEHSYAERIVAAVNSYRSGDPMQALKESLARADALALSMRCVESGRADPGVAYVAPPQGWQDIARDLRQRIGTVITVAERRSDPDDDHLSMLRMLREWEKISIRLGWPTDDPSSSSVAPPAQGWQDISTAPKDESWILLYSPTCGVEMGQWMDDVQHFDPSNATHWMPLPLPPTRGGA